MYTFGMMINSQEDTTEIKQKYYFGQNKNFSGTGDNVRLLQT